MKKVNRADKQRPQQDEDEITRLRKENDALKKEAEKLKTQLILRPLPDNAQHLYEQDCSDRH